MKSFVGLCVALLFFAPSISAQEKKVAGDVRLKQGEYPAAGSGKYLSGELIMIDPVNRRGGIRLDGDANGRYFSGPLHYFAMLPCGTISYHGAPAELRDIPIGTHVHGAFHLPPIGDEHTIPPLPKEFSRFEILQNHAISLEDDFSFYQRQGQTWRVESVDLKKGKLHVVSTGKMAPDGIQGKVTFDIDPVTRVWKQRGLVELDAIQADTTVRFNLAWAVGSRDKEFSIGEIWLDDTSANQASELQRRRHVRYEQQRWMPGWVDAVEPFDFGGGIVTLSLFGGRDASLFADMKETKSTGFWTACAEKTLRTWFHRSDRKVGQVLEWNEIANPPPGHSGIQLKLKFVELLDGYRPGRCVRLKCERWPFVTMPPEERIKSLEEQKRSATLILP